MTLEYLGKGRMLKRGVVLFLEILSKPIYAKWNILVGLLRSVSICEFEPRHEIFNNMVCATSKGSAFASHLNILYLLSYGLINILSF